MTAKVTYKPRVQTRSGVREVRSKAKKHFLPPDDAAVVVDGSSVTIQAIEARFAAIDAANPVAIRHAVYMMPVVCAWCRLDMGEKECERGQAGQTSHGICPLCREKMGQQLKAERAKTLCA